MSGELINCVLLIYGQNPKDLNRVKFLDEDLKIQEVYINAISVIIDMNANVLFSANNGKEENLKPETNSDSEVYKPQKTTCLSCKGKGKTSIKCNSDGCQNGFISATCTTCNGNYRSGKGICPNPGCNFVGCEYCDYDGAACTKCDRGKITIKHSKCNGTGKIQTSCSVCSGKGYTIK